MSKTDDFIKSELDSIQSVNMKKRFFLGTSSQDQKLWGEGGLTFGINGYRYGSLDFAWYKDKNWTDPYTNKVINKKPIIVVEGSDCLNTRSWGNAQIQRFHHLYGAFLSDLCAVYYLRKGEHDIRPELFGAVSYLNKNYRNKKKINSIISNR